MTGLRPGRAELPIMSHPLTEPPRPALRERTLSGSRWSGFSCAADARTLPARAPGSLEVDLSIARVQLVQLYHPDPVDHMFRREGIYWVDLCLTPRRPTASARYIDRWNPHRFSDLGSIIALPPGEQLHLTSAGGRHASLLCQLREDAVGRWLPQDFKWTDRRLEACLHIASERISWLLLRLFQELRSPGLAQTATCESTLQLLSIELAQYIASVSKPTEKGGLADWRLRLIDTRLAEPREPPTLADLASLCKLSVRQLTRGFRTSRGSSICAHLNQVRIDAAKRRLATDESIRMISTAMGYATQSSFTFAFRRATGTTPDEYRKRAGTERPR